MSSPGTGADGVQVYLTGAAAPGARQADQTSSLGNCRSNVRAETLTYARYSPISGIRIVWVSGANGTGLGILTASGGTTLRWKPPGAAAGEAVSIANGEEKIIEGADPAQRILVERVSADYLSGVETVQLTDTYNDVVGGSDFSAAETTAGKAKCRAVMAYAAAAATDVWFWLDADNQGRMSIAVEAQDGDGKLSEAADEEEVPTLGWAAPTTEGAALHTGALGAAGEYGLWIQPWVQAGDNAQAHCRNRIHMGYTVGGETYYDEVRGASHIAEAGIEGWLTWDGIDAEPDLTAEADVFSATKPYTLALTAGHDHYLRSAYRNQWGLVGAPDDLVVIRVDAEGEESPTPPQGPTNVAAVAYGEGAVRVTADYFPNLEASQETRAEQWVIYLRADGTNPDPEVDEPVAVDMLGGRNGCMLVWDSDEYLEDTPVSVLVRTRYNMAEPTEEEPEPEPIWVESENVTPVTAIVQWFGPVRPIVQLALGRSRGQWVAPSAAPSETVEFESGHELKYVICAGQSQFWAGDVLVWNLRCDSSRTDWGGIYTTFAWQPGGTFGEGTAEAIEVGNWDETEHIIYVNVAGVRRMKIDALAKTISVAATTPEDLDETVAAEWVWQKYAATCFQVWDAGTDEWRTGFSMDEEGILHFLDAIVGCGTEEECLG